MDFVSWLEAVWFAAMRLSIDTTQVAIFLAIVLVELGAIFVPARLKPAVLAMSAKLTTGRVALIALIGVILTRLLLAPYWVWEDEHAARLIAESKAASPVIAKIEYNDSYIQTPEERIKYGRENDNWSVPAKVRSNVVLDNACVIRLDLKSLDQNGVPEFYNAAKFPWWTGSKQFECQKLSVGVTLFEIFNTPDHAGRVLRVHSDDLHPGSPLENLKPGTYEIKLALRSSTLPFPGEIQQTFVFKWTGKMSDFTMREAAQ